VAFGGPSLAGLGPRYATVDKASYGSHVCGPARFPPSRWPVVDDIIDDVHEVTRDTTVVLLNYITKSQKGDHRLQSN
jgi:hypothetical protein